MVLLAGATSPPVLPEAGVVRAQAVGAGQGECYLINGIWICEP
jgi:hypothetical protein